MTNPLLIIARFELLYQLRQPAFYVFGALVFGQGIWYANQISNLYPYSDPVILSYLILSSLGIVLAIVAVLLAGQSLTKDIDYQSTALFFTLPITSRVHFAGRFLGTCLTTLLIALCYPAGILAFLSAYSTPSPSVWLALADGFIRLVAQNVLIVVSIPFSLTVLGRSRLGAYSSLFGIVLYFLLAEFSPDFVGNSDLEKLLDPFGVGMARESVETMPFQEDPATLLVFSDMYFINRLLWLGLSVGLLVYAESKFSFDSFTARPSRILKIDSIQDEAAAGSSWYAIQPRFGRWLSWQTIFPLTKREFIPLLRQPIFTISLGMLVLLTVFLAILWEQNPDFPQLPITARMTALRLPMGLFIGLFLLVMTVEALFRERSVGLWPIYDAVPQPTFVLLIPKIAAMAGLAALLTFVLFLTGIGVQLSNDFTNIDWTLYATDLLLDGFLRYCQLIALGAFVASLVNNRIASHLISLVIFALLAVGNQVGQPHQWLYWYSFLPQSAPYSDLIGYGSATSLRYWIHLVWWAVAGLFIMSFLLTWNRGITVPLSERIGQWRVNCRQPYRLAFAGISLVLSYLVWQTQQRPETRPAGQIITLNNKSVRVSSLSGKPILVRVQYHHPYQIAHIMRAVANALHKGESLFGPYPYSELCIREWPNSTVAVQSGPGRIMIAENGGWTADNRQPTQLDYVDYLLSREVFRQWLVHTLRPTSGPGDGLVKQSLADYLALQIVAHQYGDRRLAQRLSQRATGYAKHRQRSRHPEANFLQARNKDAIDWGRGALALTSIGQVWGDKPLSLTISEFYKKGIRKPNPVTATAFANALTERLPDSLQYLRTYLSEPLWFDFKVGRIANLVNGLTVEIIATKWIETPTGNRQPLPINDYVPLIVLDQNGRSLYRQLARPNPDKPFVSLPVLASARSVVIDPIGVWPECNKRDNAKLF